jgi:hypothetical protein
MHDRDHGGVLDPGGPGHARVYIGQAATPPHYENGTVTPVTKELRLTEGQYEPLDLPSGRYWLLSTNLSRIKIISCTANTITGTPAPLPSAWPYKSAVPPSPR